MLSPWHGIGMWVRGNTGIFENEAMKNLIVQTSNLTKTFRSTDVETTAIRNIHLDIEEGEFMAIMGPSGCGKSTLLNLLGLVDRPTSGTISFLGTNTDPLSENRRTRIRRGNMGFIFQNFNLADELNVSENVELPLVFMGMKRRERKERVKEILNEMKLGHRSHHYPRQLSGGQQQRVAFARAIVSQPQLLLADEPTGNLDSRNGGAILELLAEHNRTGATIVMVTHSHKDASYAHRIVQLIDGNLIN